MSRLRHRPMISNLEELKGLKNELALKRVEVAKYNKSKEWKLEDLLAILSSLKSGKSRDPHGLINEIFKPGVAGKDFQNSFLGLANKVRDELFIPKFMQYSNIVSIYKVKGEKMNLDNDRGIFIVNIFRAIIMKIVYNGKYLDLAANDKGKSKGEK